MTTPFLKGIHVYLRGIQRTDLEGPMRHWTNDREVTRFMYRGAFPTTPERLEREHESRQNRNDEVEFALVECGTDQHIGLVGLHNLNWVARAAEFRILIGQKDTWGKGYGTEATQLACAYGFEVLNLHKIWLGVNAQNRGAVRAYEKAGMTHEGVLRDEIYRNSEYYDAIRMSLLRSEYDEQRDEWPIVDQLNEQFPRSH